ncbi:MAG TPA: hypothetical protein VGM94_01720 [Galbitalea sp.]
MSRVPRARKSMPIAIVGLLVLAAAGPANGRGVDKQPTLTADLDGKPIALVEVGNWYCNDFDYPAIHCFSDPKAELQSSAAALAAPSGTYVTVYEFTTYQGAYMHMTQDYSILGLIGWSDRISSFQVTNSAGGVFWTDWLYTGTRYNFCCYQNVGSLGSFNDTFSSVFHN